MGGVFTWGQWVRDGHRGSILLVFAEHFDIESL